MITWSEQYEIGIPVIDGQHQRIVGYINQVEELKDNPNNQSELAEVLAMLVDYTWSHFEFEEALMEESSYPDLAEHQVTHHAFKNQIEALYRRFKSGENVAPLLADILLNWLLEHIQEDDASYCDCVKKNILGRQDKHNESWIQQATAKYFGLS
ncbi:bacteriohemerythrin [Teredinibacter haidensis]|uniref:bacteriohemerythrin n=1 Tax=Teredinibacter haidensis TaxID=2731755 RepID=UPI000949171E|nr:bacteriohemerythrin [Teredinibacter haidensis]